jgi:hypothetical protein
MGQQLGQGAEHQVEPLLRSQPAHRHEQRRVGILRQAQRLLQRGLAAGLAGQLVNADRGGEAVSVPGPRPRHPPRSGCPRRRRPRPRTSPSRPQPNSSRGDLAGIGGADGGHARRILQPGLHERQLAVELQPAAAHEPRRQAQQRKSAGRTAPGRPGCARCRRWRAGGCRAGPPDRRRRWRHASRAHAAPAAASRVEFACGQVGRPPSPATRSAAGCRPLAPWRAQVGVAAAPVHSRRVDHVGRHAAALQRPMRKTRDRAAPNIGSDARHHLCAILQRLRAWPGSPAAAAAHRPPAATSAWGSAPTTSASPPVLTQGRPRRGRTRAAYLTTLMRADLGQHFGGDQADAVGAAVEALGVQLRVLADHHAVGDRCSRGRSRCGSAGMAADLHLRQQHRPVDVAYECTRTLENSTERAPSRHDAAARHQRLDGHAAAAVLVVHELGRRQLLLVGPDRPALVVQVERRRWRSGRCWRPSRRRPCRRRASRLAGEGRLLATQLRSNGWPSAWPLRTACGNDVLAEVVAGIRVGHVPLEQAVEVVGALKM